MTTNNNWIEAFLINGLQTMNDCSDTCGAINHLLSMWYEGCSTSDLFDECYGMLGAIKTIVQEDDLETEELLGYLKMAKAYQFIAVTIKEVEGMQYQYN